MKYIGAKPSPRKLLYAGALIVVAIALIFTDPIPGHHITSKDAILTILFLVALVYLGVQDDYRQQEAFRKRRKFK